MVLNPDNKRMPRFGWRQNMIFERGIWAETFRNFWTNKWVVLAVVVILTARAVVEDYTQSSGVGGIWVGLVWFPLIIAAHATILNGTNGFYGINGDQFRTVYFPFLWRSLGLSMICFLPAFAIAFLVAGSENVFELSIIVMLSYAAFASFVLAKWGTMLPACVALGNRTIKAASARGSKTFGYIIGRFWVCNTLLLVVGFIGIVVASTIANRLSSTANSIGHYVIEAVEQTLIALMLAMNLVLLATILSRAYLIAEAEMKKAAARASAS